MQKSLFFRQDNRIYGIIAENYSFHLIMSIVLSCQKFLFFLRANQCYQRFPPQADLLWQKNSYVFLFIILFINYPLGKVKLIFRCV